MDVLVVKEVGECVVVYCCVGKGFYIFEVKIYCYCGYLMFDLVKYCICEEVQKMCEECDLIEQICLMLLIGNYVIEDDFKVIDKDIKVIVNESVEFLKESLELLFEELWIDIYV